MYTVIQSCTFTTLRCNKVTFIHCWHMKINQIFKKNVRGVLTSVRYCNGVIIRCHYQNVFFFMRLS